MLSHSFCVKIILQVAFQENSMMQELNTIRSEHNQLCLRMLRIHEVSRENNLMNAEFDWHQHEA